MKNNRRKLSIKNPASSDGGPSRKFDEENKDNSADEVFAVNTSVHDSRRYSPMKKLNSASKLQ